jgi:hypothetical protein
MIFADDPSIQIFYIHPVFMINSSSLPTTYTATLKRVKEENQFQKRQHNLYSVNATSNITAYYTWGYPKFPRI